MSQGSAKAGHFKLSDAPFSAVASLSSGCFVATSVRGAIGSAVARALPISGFCMSLVGVALGETVDVVGIGAQVSVESGLYVFMRPPATSHFLSPLASDNRHATHYHCRIAAHRRGRLYAFRDAGQESGCGAATHDRRERSRSSSITLYWGRDFVQCLVRFFADRAYRRGRVRGGFFAVIRSNFSDGHTLRGLEEHGAQDDAAGTRTHHVAHPEPLQGRSFTYVPFHHPFFYS